MRWTTLRPGQGQGFLGCLEAAVSLDGLDPQLIWIDVAKLRGLARPGDRLLPVSFEAQADAQGRLVLPDSSLVELNAGTLAVMRTSGGRIVTGFAKAGRIAELAERVERLRVGMLAPHAPGRGKALRSTAARAARPERQPAPRREELVIGVIDHGIAFANRQFAGQRAGRWHSRIERLWDQHFGVPGATPAPRAVIDELMNSGADETAIYRLAAYRPAQSAQAHGAHVMGLAAGRTRFSGAGPTQDWADPASLARIIAVQLPHEPVKDTSGQSLHVHLLDAVCYILHHAAGRKVVINLSDGAFAGPHDGQSMLERALSTLFPQRARDRVLVLAAGNQFDERVLWVDALPARAECTLAWRLMPDDRTDSHMEIWFDAGLAPQALRGLSVRVAAPGGTASPALRLGQSAVWHEDGPAAAVRACVTFARRAPNALGGRCMVAISVAPTLAPRSQVPLAQAHHGVWQITLVNGSDDPVSLQARIERDNPALGERGPRRQSHFIHPDYPRDQRLRIAALDDSDNHSPIRRMGALNSVASAAHLLVAGGYVAATRRLAPYSASGPGRAGAVPGVDVLAPSDAGQARHGLRSAGVRSGSTFRMDGTSVAAPAVTRAVANLMGQKPDIGDLQGALRRMALRDVAGPRERVGAGRLP